MILFYDSRCCCYIYVEPLHPSGKALLKPDDPVSNGLYRNGLSRDWTALCQHDLGQAGARTPRDVSLHHLDKLLFLNKPALTPAKRPPPPPPGAHAAAVTTAAATFTPSGSRPGRSRWAADRLRRRSALGRVSMAQRGAGAGGGRLPSPPPRPAVRGRAEPSLSAVTWGAGRAAAR